jgi:hypothetical protein
LRQRATRLRGSIMPQMSSVASREPVLLGQNDPPFQRHGLVVEYGRTVVRGIDRPQVGVLGIAPAGEFVEQQGLVLLNLTEAFVDAALRQ